MVDYVYDVSTTFPQGLKLSRLIEELEESSLEQFSMIYIEGDDLIVEFDEALGSQTDLDDLLALHDPDYVTVHAETLIKDGLLSVDFDGLSKQFYGSVDGVVVVSLTGQGDYTSLTLALAAIGSQENVVIFMNPGTYVEANPLTIPPGTVIQSRGTPENTLIVASDPDSDLLVATSRNKISGVAIYGAYGVGSRGIYFDSSYTVGVGNVSIMSGCYVVDCYIGIECDGHDFSGLKDTLYSEKLVISSQNHNCLSAVYCHSGGQFISSVFYAISSGAPTYTIGNALHCDGDGTKVSLVTASSWYCGKGAYLNNGGEAEFSLFNMNGNTDGLVIGPDGVSIVSANSLEFSDITQYEISIESLNARVEIYSAFLNDSKLHNPNNVGMTLRYNSLKYGNNYQTLIGSTQIGNSEFPSKLSVGEGIYTDNNVVVYTNTLLEEGVWDDITSSALLEIPVSNFGMFPTGVKNEVMYIGSTKVISGLKVQITTAVSSAITSVDLVWEYWDGSVWVIITPMILEKPDETIKLDPVVNDEGKYQLYFGLTSASTLATKTLNGHDLYWMRYRIENTIPSVPDANYIKLNSNSKVIGRDGKTRYYGDARPIYEEILKPSLRTTIVNEDLYINSGFSITPFDGNAFSASLDGSLEFVLKFPKQMDTSFAFEIPVSFIGTDSAAGDVVWDFELCYVTLGSSVYNSSGAASGSTNVVIEESTTTVIGADEENQVKYETFTVRLDGIIAPEHGTLMMRLTRNGLSGADTYLGTIGIINITHRYHKWIE